MRSLVRISAGKAIQRRAPGHSVNRRTLKTEKLLFSSPSRKSALTQQVTRNFISLDVRFAQNDGRIGVLLFPALQGHPRKLPRDVPQRCPLKCPQKAPRDWSMQISPESHIWTNGTQISLCLKVYQKNVRNPSHHYFAKKVLQYTEAEKFIRAGVFHPCVDQNDENGGCHQVRKNSLNIKFLGGIFLGHPGPRRRDIPDKNFRQVAFFCCFRQRVAGMSRDLGRDVPDLENFMQLSQL